MRFIFTFILFSLMLSGLLFPVVMTKPAFVALAIQMLLIATTTYLTRKETAKKSWLTLTFTLCLSLVAGFILGLFVFEIPASSCLILSGMFTSVMSFITDLYVGADATK